MNTSAKTFSLLSKFSFSNFSFIVPETPTVITEYNVFQKHIFDFNKFIQFKQKFLIREHTYLHFQQILIPCFTVPFKRLTRSYVIELVTAYFNCFNVINFDPLFLDGFLSFHLSLLLNHRDVINNVVKIWAEATPQLDDWRSLTTAFTVYPLGDFAKDVLIDLCLKGPMFRVYSVFRKQTNFIPEVIINLTPFLFFRNPFKTLEWKTVEKMSEMAIKKFYQVDSIFEYIQKYHEGYTFIYDMLYVTSSSYARVHGNTFMDDFIFVRHLEFSGALRWVRVYLYYMNFDCSFICHIADCGWDYNYLLGCMLFLLSGGESNPGPPIFSRLMNYLLPQLQQARAQLRSFSSSMDSCKDLLILAIYLNRLTDQLFSFISVITRGALTSTFDLLTKTSSFVITLYETHKVVMSQLGLTFTHHRAQAGDIESFAIAAGLAAFMPKCLHSIFRDLQVFTNMKFLDDLTLFQEFLAFLISLPRRMFSLFQYSGIAPAVCAEIILCLKDFELLIPFSELGVLASQLESINVEYSKNQRLHCNKTFQTRALSFKSKFLETKQYFLSRKRNLPSYFVNTSIQYEKILKLITYATTDTRAEPVALVFCGPPGTGKSCLTAQLINAYKETQTIYTDTPTDAMKKKFYDSYQNEDIYVVDDMGAKAVSQWSEIINQVSTVKYKLECAAIENKDSKFFTSPLMLISTNSIPTAQMILPTDGMKDIEAFYRRLHRVEFTDVKFDNGVYSGTIRIQLFDRSPGVKKWVDHQIHNITSTQSLVEFIDAYIRVEMKKRNDNFDAQNNNVVKLAPLPLHKSQGKTFDSIFTGLQNFAGCFPFGEKAFDFMVDMTASASESLDAYFPTLAALSDQLECSSFTLIAIISLMGLSTLALGSCIHDFFTKKQTDDVQSVLPSKHYNAMKTDKMDIIRIVPQSVSEILSISPQYDATPPQLAKYQNNVIILNILLSRKGITSNNFVTALISVDKILIPLHAVYQCDNSKVYFTAYTKGNTILYDKMEADVIFINEDNDLAVLQIPKTAPKYFRKLNIITRSQNRDLFFITPGGTILMKDKISQARLAGGYFGNGYNGSIQSTDLVYPYNADGFCGAWIVNADGYLVAMHCARRDIISEGVESSQGIARVIHSSVLIQLQNIFDVTFGVVLPTVQFNNDKFSGARIDVEVPNFVNNKSSISPSLIHGIFPLERKPAEFKEKKKMLALSVDSFTETPNIDLKPVEFARDIVIEKLKPIGNFKFKGLTERELVLGNEHLNRIDPKTSAGFGFDGGKKEWLDYEQGIIKEPMKQRVRDFATQVISGTFKYDEYYTTTFKDELRNVDDTGKTKDPRIFQAGTLLLTLLYRFFFGELMIHTSQNRHRNGIMVGMNPLCSEWDKFAKNLLQRSSRNMYDGDFKWWDKKMHPILQRMLSQAFRVIIPIEQLRSSFNTIFSMNLTKDQFSLVFEACLELIISTPTRLLNCIFITTHNMPSGVGVTAFYNSCINLMVTAFVYYVRSCELNHKPTVREFVQEVDDYVYGDDKLLNCSDSVAPFLNPFHFARIVKTIGFEFTKADKSAWTENDVSSISNVSFLKRTFFFHPVLQQWVAPLEIRSMQSTLNYITDSNRDVELTTIKLENFQRELYLHYFQYFNQMNYITSFLRQSNILLNPKFLSEQSLIDMYSKNEYGDTLYLN
jgi:hypothetical protein